MNPQVPYGSLSQPTSANYGGGGEQQRYPAQNYGYPQQQQQQHQMLQQQSMVMYPQQQQQQQQQQQIPSGYPAYALPGNAPDQQQKFAHGMQQQQHHQQQQRFSYPRQPFRGQQQTFPQQQFVSQQHQNPQAAYNPYCKVSQATYGAAQQPQQQQQYSMQPRFVQQQNSQMYPQHQQFQSVNYPQQQQQQPHHPVYTQANYQRLPQIPQQGMVQMRPVVNQPIMATSVAPATGYHNQQQQTMAYSHPQQNQQQQQGYFAQHHQPQYPQQQQQQQFQYRPMQQQQPQRFQSPNISPQQQQQYPVSNAQQSQQHFPQQQQQNDQPVGAEPNAAGSRRSSCAETPELPQLQPELPQAEEEPQQPEQEEEDADEDDDDDEVPKVDLAEVVESDVLTTNWSPDDDEEIGPPASVSLEDVENIASAIEEEIEDDEEAVVIDKREESAKAEEGPKDLNNDDDLVLPPTLTEEREVEHDDDEEKCEIDEKSHPEIDPTEIVAEQPRDDEEIEAKMPSLLPSSYGDVDRQQPDKPAEEAQEAEKVEESKAERCDEEPVVVDNLQQREGDVAAEEGMIKYIEGEVEPDESQLEGPTTSLPMPQAKPKVFTDKVTVPWGWKRLVLSDSVIYYSPSGIQFKTREDVERYLTRDGTCKCGLSCPLDVNKVFDFDDSKQSEVLSYPQIINSQSGKHCAHKKTISALAMRDKTNRFMEKINHIHNPNDGKKGGKKKNRQRQKPFPGLKVSEMLEAREAERQRINEIINQQKQQHEARQVTTTKPSTITSGDNSPGAPQLEPANVFQAKKEDSNSSSSSKNSEIRRMSATDEGDKILSEEWTSPEKEGKQGKTPLELVENIISNIVDEDTNSNSASSTPPVLQPQQQPPKLLPAVSKKSSTSSSSKAKSNPPSTATSLSSSVSGNPPALTIQQPTQPSMPQQTAVVTAAPSSTPTVMQLVNTINGPVLMQAVPIGAAQGIIQHPNTPVTQQQPPAILPAVQPSFAAIPSLQQQRPILKKRAGKKKGGEKFGPVPSLRPAVPILMSPQPGTAGAAQPQILTAAPAHPLQPAGNILVNQSGQVVAATNMPNQMILSSNGTLVSIPPPQHQTSGPTPGTPTNASGVMFSQLADGTLVQLQAPPSHVPIIQGQQIITSGQFAGPIFVNNQQPGAAAQGTFFMTPQGMIQASPPGSQPGGGGGAPVASTAQTLQPKPSTSYAKSPKKSSPSSRNKAKQLAKKSQQRDDDEDDSSEDDSDEDDEENQRREKRKSSSKSNKKGKTSSLIKGKKSAAKVYTVLDVDDDDDDEDEDEDNEVEEIVQVFSSPTRTSPKQHHQHHSQQQHQQQQAMKLSPKTFIQSNQVDSSGLQATPPHHSSSGDFDAGSKEDHLQVSTSVVLNDSLDTSGSSAGTSSSSSGRKRKRNAEELLKDSWLPSDDEEESEKSPVLNEEPKHFSVGEVVWGPHSNIPSWPGKVIESGPEDNSVQICWFGTKEVSVMQTVALKNLTDGLDAHHRQRKKLRKGRKMNPGLERAIQEAMTELD